jgi:hypothetical protein
MRVLAATALLFILLAVPAIAGTIETLQPSSVAAGSGEYFLEIRGSKLGTSVLFSGPGGKFEVPVQDQAIDVLYVWVPEPVINTAGSYSVTMRGADGLSNVARFEVIKAKVPLVLHIPDPVVVEATSRKGAIVTFTVTSFGGEDPSPTVKCDIPSGSQFPIGLTEVKCTAENRFGERASGQVSVLVHDDNGPVVTVPKRIVVPPDSRDGAIVKFEVRAADLLDGDASVECKPSSGSLFPVGVTRVDCIAFDLTKNEGYGSFEVEVLEKAPSGLVLHVPDEMRVEATSRFGAKVSYVVTVSGTGDPSPSIKCDPPSDTTFKLGQTTVGCTATDRFGASARETFSVVVTDSVAPELRLQDITAEASGGVAKVTWDLTGNDLVDGKLSVTCNPTSGSEFKLGQTVVECSSTDYSLNSATGTFLVNVVDSFPPMITSVSPSVTAQSPSDSELREVELQVQAVDANDAMPRCRVTGITANEALAAPGRGDSYDWLITGPLTVKLRAKQTGDRPRIYTIGIACADLAGNEADAATNVDVKKASAKDSSTTPPAPPRRRAAGGH